MGNNEEALNRLNRKINGHISKTGDIQKQATETTGDIRQASEIGKHFSEECEKSPKCVDRLLDEYRLRSKNPRLSENPADPETPKNT